MDMHSAFWCPIIGHSNGVYHLPSFLLGLLDKLNEEHKRNAAKSIAEARKSASLLKEEIAALKDLVRKREGFLRLMYKEMVLSVEQISYHPDFERQFCVIFSRTRNMRIK